MKLKTTRILEENLGSTIQDIGIGKDFMMKAIATETNIDKWHLIKELLHSKRNYHQNEQSTEWKHIFALYPSDKG